MSATFSKILLAFDGSYSSYNALKKATSLAVQNNAHLTVAYVKDSNANSPFVHEKKVFPHSVPVPNNNINYVNPTTDDENEPHNNIVNKPSPNKILSDARVSLSNTLKAVDYELLTGKPGHEICKYAKQNEFDLIVIGKRGFSGMKELVMGRVSNHVTNHSYCPVLVCK